MYSDNSKNVSAATAAALEAAEISAEDFVKRAKLIADKSFQEAAATDSVEKFPFETMRKITEKGLLAAPLPKNFGGLGIGLESGTNFALLQILKHLGRGNPVVGRVYEGHFNALLLIKLFGTDEQFEHFAEDAKRGKLFGVWNTQADDGVKISPIGNDKFRLTGSKIFATGIGFVNRPLVTGALPKKKGWQMFVVPLDETDATIDASWWNPLGMRATRSFKIDFSGVEIKQKNLIGKPENYYRQPWFSGGSIRFAAVQIGAAEAIFDETRKYLQMLKRTGDPYQKMRLGEMAILVESGNLWLKEAAEKLDEYMKKPSKAKSENFLAYANMMRSAIEKICVQIMDLCKKSVGARGLNKPFHFERIIRDLTIYLCQPAPDAALADVGRYVLKSKTAADDLW